MNNEENKDLMFAILFEELPIEELDFPIFKAVRPMFGYLSDNKNVFTDILTDRKYLSCKSIYDLGFYECFGALRSIEELQKGTGEAELQKISKTIWSYYDNLPCIFGTAEGEILPDLYAISNSEFIKMTGLKFISSTLDIKTNNNLFSKYENGEITIDELIDYIYKIYDQLTSGEKTKVLTINFNQNK